MPTYSLGKQIKKENTLPEKDQQQYTDFSSLLGNDNNDMSLAVSEPYQK